MITLNLGTYPKEIAYGVKEAMSRGLNSMIGGYYKTHKIRLRGRKPIESRKDRGFTSLDNATHASIYLEITPPQDGQINWQTRHKLEQATADKILKQEDIAHYIIKNGAKPVHGMSVNEMLEILLPLACNISIHEIPNK